MHTIIFFLFLLLDTRKKGIIPMSPAHYNTLSIKNYKSILELLIELHY